MYYLSLDGCGWVQTQRFLRCDSGRVCGMMDHDGHVLVMTLVWGTPLFPNVPYWGPRWLIYWRMGVVGGGAICNHPMASTDLQTPTDIILHARAGLHLVLQHAFDEVMKSYPLLEQMMRSIYMLCITSLKTSHITITKEVILHCHQISGCSNISLDVNVDADIS